MNEPIGIPQTFPPSLAGTIGVKRNGAGELPAIQLNGILTNSDQHGISILGKLIDLVDKIHEQELLGQFQRDVLAPFKLIDTYTQIKSAVPFLVADDPLVIELRCTRVGCKDSETSRQSGRS